MSPVAELRSAAVLLRQRATDATPGPWALKYPSPSTVTNTSIVSATTDARVVASAGGLPPNSWPSRPDADYIATVHPLVGLALADHLDAVAASAEWLDAKVSGPLLRLARLILGGGS